MRKLLLLGVFFAATPVILVVSLIFLTYLSYKKNQVYTGFAFSEPVHNVAFAALPTTENVLDYTVEQADGRAEILKQFFKEYKSPLEPYAQEIVAKADQYNLDFRLVPSIAMQESNLCHKEPAHSHNCWGFGIYGGKILRFDNYSEAIDAVSKTLSTNYLAQGLDTPQEIMHKYTPSSNGSWAHGVSTFMDELE
jgi:hypothetical protein